MTTAPAPTKPPVASTATWKVLLPYGLALLAQVPMLILYFKKLWILPHYQPFAIAILATVGIALYRWPFDQTQKFHRSISSDFLLVLGVIAAFMGMLFVEPWFTAASAMLIVTSLFARTIDRETLQSLWPAALPLFVYLTLPLGWDVRLITTLQRYSAIYTSRLLDLFGLGHHMNGTVIKVPGLKEYGIEEACSGVQSFFTLMLVGVIFIVLSRRLKIPSAAVGLVGVMGAILCFVLRGVVSSDGFSDILLLAAVGFLFVVVLGFRAAALLISAVFWAVFMNTVRILLIPLADNMFGMDLSTGWQHQILGYSTLIFGILMLFSTDQFLLFLFGPVEQSSGEAGPFGRVITRFWNKVLSGQESEENEGQPRRKRRGRVPVSKGGRTLIWVVAGLMIAMGIFQLVDVQRALSRSDLSVRFFEADVTTEYDKNDMPEFVDTWKQVDFDTDRRNVGSDLGERSDIWQFRSPNCAAVASIDQTFPGWHELTTCYRNQGWKLVSRIRKTPSEVLGESGDEDKWAFIEATFEKKTGEKGYLLFSHFDAFGKPVDAPGEWGTLNSLILRAKNRLSHRIRSSLFRGEVFQTQVFLTSFRELDPSLKQEVNERYLKIREQLRKRYVEKNQGADGEEAKIAQVEN